MGKTTFWTKYQLLAKSPEKRLQAVKKLRDIASESAVELLTRSLADENEEVRRESALALGEIKDKRAIESLAAALNDSAESVQQAAVHALKKIGGAASTRALFNTMMRGRPGIQWSASRALRALNWQPANSNEEIQFLVALGEFERAKLFGSPAIGALAAAARTASFEKRVAAIEALTDIDDPAVLKPLQSALKDSDPVVRTAAAYAFGRRGSADHVPLLAAMLKDRDRNVRATAANALGQLGNAQAVESLMPLLNDPEWEVRAAVLEALGRLGDSRAFESVAAKLEDRDEEVRQNAADALAQVGDESVVEKLILTLVDEHSGVRQAAARALARIDPYWERSERAQAILPQLEAAARHKDVSVAYAAAGVLRRLTGSAAVSTAPAAPPVRLEKHSQPVVTIFEELLQDVDEEVRLAAAETLGRLRAPECAAALTAAMVDVSEWVRIAAQESLEALAQPTAALAR